MVAETFSNIFGNAYLQRRLLVVKTQTIEATIEAGNEFLQIRTTGNRELQRGM